MPCSNIQSSAVIMRSNVIRYCIDNYTNWGRISIRCWIHKRHPIPRPNRRAMRCHLWENWPHYNGTALYLGYHWFMIQIVAYPLFNVRWWFTLMLMSIGPPRNKDLWNLIKIQWYFIQEYTFWSALCRHFVQAWVCWFGNFIADEVE